MKCLILGGAGFIGAHLAEGLLAEGHTIRILDLPNLLAPEHLRADPNVQWIEGNFLNKNDLVHAVQGIEVVFHLVSATLPKSSNDNPVYDVESNIVGTLHLLDAARLNGIRLIVFASSGGTVYGLPKALPIKEDHVTEPMVSYGISKLAIEKYLHLYKHLYDLDYCVLRLANPFGERQRSVTAQGAVGVFLHQALHGRPINIWGDGSVTRDYIYIKDVVRAFVKVMTWGGQQRIFNIGSGCGMSLNDVIISIENLLGKPVARTYEPGRKFDVPINILDISAAREQLGWQPEVRFDDALEKTFEWMRESQYVDF